MHFVDERTGLCGQCRQRAGLRRFATLQQFQRQLVLCRNVIRPAFRRAQQTLRKSLGVVVIRKERGVAALRKHPAHQPVDHRIEHKVLHPGGARKQRRVTEQHVVQFVHNEREQLLRGRGVFCHEDRVDQKPRLRAAFHRRRRHAGGFNNVEQA